MLRCAWCGDEIPDDAGAALVSRFISHHASRQHGLTSAEVALERGQLEHAVRILLWLQRYEIEEPPVPGPVIREEVTS